MIEFILDVNMDLDAKCNSYPSYLFNDLRQRADIKLVRGGRDYDKEIKKKNSFVQVMNVLEKAGKVRRINHDLVDAKQSEIEKRIEEKQIKCPSQCDDFHIFALSLVSSCRNIVTGDSRMAKCRRKIRPKLGHDYCPNIRVIKDEKLYKKSLNES